ncbi:MAG: CCA tRNA nucleotidyltransferase [Sphingomonas sp.]|nr:CCA tRNA nucleotidyltransferase [Sphingomonas sp.]
MDMTIDATHWRRRRGMAKLLEALGADEGLTRYVGGAVRDELLQLPVNDVDLATRLLPDEVVKRLQAAGIKAVPTGIQHGTVTAVSDGHPYEITTLRRDVETFGRHATVAFTDDWREDSARRDFTINALMADPLSGEVFDYFGGLQDLEARHVRFIGDPFERIAEDHLRILRFFRFHARFGLAEPDSAALAACSARANDLMALSRERIADELIKLLAVDDPTPTIRVMLDRGILKPVIPEIGSIAAGRLESLVESERASKLAPEPLRRLASLLPREPETAGNVAARLKLSNRARKRLACAASDHLAPDPRAIAYRDGVECAVDRLLLGGRPADAAAIAEWTPPRLPVRGGALIRRGVTQGPLVSRTLRMIEDRWIEAGFPHGAELEAIVTQALAESHR